MCDLSVQSTRGYKNRVVRVQYARTVLMTQFASRALYAVPRVKSEVYFGLYVTGTILTMSLLPFWVLIMVVPLLSMDARELSDFIRNILICVTKMKEGVTGLE